MNTKIGDPFLRQWQLSADLVGGPLHEHTHPPCSCKVLMWIFLAEGISLGRKLAAGSEM